MPNLPLCHWSSRLFDLCAPLSTDVPVLLLNQPIIISEQSTHFGWSFTGGSSVVERIVVKYFLGKFGYISCSPSTIHFCLDSFVMVSLYIKVNRYLYRQVLKFY